MVEHLADYLHIPGVLGSLHYFWKRLVIGPRTDHVCVLEAMEVTTLLHASLHSFRRRFTVGLRDLLVYPLLDRIHELDWAHTLAPRVVLWLCDIWLVLFLDAVDFGNPSLLLFAERLDARFYFRQVPWGAEGSWHLFDL